MKDPTIIVVLIFFAAIVIIGVLFLVFRGKGGGRKPVTDDLLKGLEKQDPLWKKETMLDTVRSTFDVLKKSYDTKKSHVQSDMMTVNIYRDLFKNIMPNLKKLAFIERMNIKNLEITQVSTHRDESRNSFTARIEMEGEAQQEHKTHIFWTFIKVGNKWLLSEVHEDHVPAGYFPHK